ncbi:MAG: hypothetical protein H6726_01320 [Sandaracinaceae bacterium]|nr:hypothetical protein [Sandaracinaceae bacterium]
MFLPRWSFAGARSGALIVCVAHLLGSGCGASGGASSSGSTVAVQTVPAAYAQGQAVQVEWRGSWYAATILGQQPDGMYRIHYDGWSDEWDESVDTTRIRLPQASDEGTDLPEVFVQHPGAEGADGNMGSSDDPGGWTPTPDTDLPVGLAVHVEWRGRWYRAEILEAPPYGETCRVHYPGWSDEWDEEVPRTRIRVDGGQP